MQFSHLYIEKEALDYPLTRDLQRTFPEARLVILDDYKHFFNRPRQNFLLQRKSPKLIIARQQQSFLEEGADRVKSFGSDRVFSCSIIRNCLYHCDYCFLEGMHQSSNIVVYANTDDFKTHIHKLAHALPDEKLCIIASYLTDLPAFEHFIPACQLFIDMVRGLHNVTLEIRTKSDGFKNIAHIRPPSNTVLVFSLSPQEIVRTYEHGTASLHTRVLQAWRAMDTGWRVRLCFDPILYSRTWVSMYQQCIERVFSRLNSDMVEMVSYGVFRMGATFLNRMRSRNIVHPQPSVLRKHIQIQSGLGTYPEPIVQEIRDGFFTMLREFISANKIHFVHG